MSDGFNLLRFITIILVSCGINLVLTREFIRYIGSKVYQVIRSEEVFLASHAQTKQHTPTFGGLPMLISILLTTFLLIDWHNPYILILLLVAITFGSIGFIDDFVKVRYKTEWGFKGSKKLIAELIMAVLIVLFLVNGASQGVHLISDVHLPFFAKLAIPLGIFYIPFTMFVIVGSCNGNNLTDGLDGLDILTVIMIVSVLAIIAAIAGDPNLAAKYTIGYLPRLGEVTMFCAAIIGSGLGFFYYNHHPAKIFMGDTGSLMLGALLGVMAVMTKHELTFTLAALLLLIESLSVIIQITSMKFFHRRVFLMAPIHHHFEKLGWPETKVTKVFWSFTFICCNIAICSIFYKLPY